MSEEKTKDKETIPTEKIAIENVATETEIEKPELTEFGKFCQRHGINPNLIMLKVSLFLMYGGK